MPNVTNKPMLSVELELTDQQEYDLIRFHETCEDSQPYDVSKDGMKSLACLGLVRSTGFSRYELTGSGDAVIYKLLEFLRKKPCSDLPVPASGSTTSDKYKAELYDEVWQLARSMGFNNVTEAMTGRVSPQDLESECTSCDGSGEHTDAIGDWRGYCACPAGVEAEGLKGDKP